MRLLRGMLALCMILLPAGPFEADIFPVTKTEDTNDGACDADCSLREAIEAANAGPGADDVLVPAGNYLLTLGQLTVSDDVSIAGAGRESTILRGCCSQRVFGIEASTVAQISDVEVGHGNGGISNQGSLTLTNTTVTDNYVNYGAVGVGIYNGYQGVLVLTDSIVSENSAGFSVGAAHGDGVGGGIYNRGVLTLTNSTVSGNFASIVGGGIHNDGGDVIVTNSTVTGNFAFWGGGVYARGTYYYDNNTEGETTLNNSLVTGNSSLEGAGIYVFADWGAKGSVTLMNSTVSGNGASRGGGGGILARLDGAAYGYDFSVSLVNSTLSGNTGASGGGILVYGEADRLDVTSTIIADNAGSASGNCSDSIHSLGHNVTDDDSCGFTAAGDLVVADAMLGPLADNGGPTQTHALLPGSPAIDAGSPDCPPPDTDQRGVARPQGAGCDIGAFELAPLAVAIDIRPGSEANPIQPNAKGIVPVALLGSDAFDVADVDVTTLAFAAGGAAPAHDLSDPAVLADHLQDADGDGVIDLVSYHRMRETDIAPGDREACLRGATLEGMPFEGCDAIRSALAVGRRRSR